MPIFPTPEIDGATLASGLGLLIAGILMLRARWSEQSRKLAGSLPEGHDRSA